MFKSVFAKYVTVVMAIMAIGFAILLVVLTSIMGNLISNDLSEEMDRIGTAASAYLEEALTGQEASRPLRETVSELFVEGSVSRGRFEALLVVDPDLNILITDQNGALCARFFGNSMRTNEAVTLPIRFSSIENGENEVVESARVSELFSSEILLYTTGIFSPNGEKLGYLSVSSTKAPNGRIMEDLIHAVISAVLLVLTAAMIAVYLISERVTSPLREMRSVARKLGKGDFSSRVLVKGGDEVAELADAFNRMADSLENLEKMRSSFIANVSHDLRTPMTAISGFVDGIRDGVIPPEQHGHYLEVISEEVKRLSRLVSSLLDLSRLQAGDRKFSPRTFDVCEMARLILISFEQRIEDKRLEVEFDCERDRMQVYADRDAIYQVFYNVCHNAIKFSNEGGILRIRITEPNGRVQVAVYDQGKGIPEEDLPYVFDRFYKSDKSRGLDKSGVGLGLFISKTIMEAHGERIWVNGGIEECEFFFTLSKPTAGQLNGNSEGTNSQKERL
ncbi:MAG: HAMP domain-containing histidine kinase [Ruminococcaceae bacterium]|nr:HAMP domain-containing histidine kinase [Oscillospiraceae bacterium]